MNTSSNSTTIAPTTAQRRLMRDLRDLSQNPVDGINAAPVSADNIFQWNAILDGPEESLFEDASFVLTLKFPQDYPNHPPEVKFVTRVFHPNICKRFEQRTNIDPNCVALFLPRYGWIDLFGYLTATLECEFRCFDSADIHSFVIDRSQSSVTGELRSSDALSESSSRIRTTRSRVHRSATDGRWRRREWRWQIDSREEECYSHDNDKYASSYGEWLVSSSSLD